MNPVCVSVASGCVKNNSAAKFYFSLGIGYIEYDCVEYVNVETGKHIGYRLTTLWRDGGYTCFSPSRMYEWLEHDKRTRKAASDFLAWSEKAQVGETFPVGRSTIEVIEEE